jgi:hypothetical protein
MVFHKGLVPMILVAAAAHGFVLAAGGQALPQCCRRFYARLTQP